MPSEAISLQDTGSLEKGDWIVHQRYGVGEVRAVDQKKLSGEEKKYFRVKTEKGATYWLPVNKNPNYIRLISPRSQIKKALDLISQAPEDLPKNYRKRNAYVANELSEANIYIKGRMIRDLHARGPNKDVNLTVIDRRKLDELRGQFLREMAVALEIEMEEAETILTEALDKSTSYI